MDAREIVSSTAEPAFATDEKGRLVLWNAAALDLLRLPPERLVGKPCHEILRGTDLFGNRHCCERCSLHQMVRRREAVHDFELDVSIAGGERRRVAVSVVVVPGVNPARYWIVHILRPLAASLGRPVAKDMPAPGELSGADRRARCAAPRSSPRFAALTPRELEILDLMTLGVSTPEISDRLCISTTTVRNHVQHILAKLNVHTKMQAVSLALRKPARREEPLH